VLHVAVANGFPPATYAPLLIPLRHRVHAVSLPPRALWPGIGPPPRAAGTWLSLVDDLIRGLEAHRIEPVIGLGHSFGAVVSLVAATRVPERFAGLILLDPTIFAPGTMDAVARQREADGAARFALVEGALKRRRHFDSPDQALTYWRSRPLLADWPEESLRCYVASMLQPAERGYDLSWSPEWEAWYYRSFYPHTWGDVARVPRGLPVLVVRGETSDTFPEDAEHHLRTLLPAARCLTIPGAGHLFPQARPEQTAAVIAQWLDDLSLHPYGEAVS
jgi:pimeloyl-ACP methyl ester carboxylesterase